MKNLIYLAINLFLFNSLLAQFSFQDVNSQAVGKTVGRMATDISGNNYLTGAFATSITFGNTTLVNTAPTGGTGGGAQSASYIAKFSAAGTVIWAKAINLKNITSHSTSGVYISRIYVDDAGFVYITGAYQGRITLDNITLTSLKNTNGDYSWDIFTAKMSSSGSFLWAKSEGTGSETFCQGGEEGISVTKDPNGNVYATGRIIAKVLNLSKNETGSNCVCGGTKLIFGIYLVKYNSSGTKIWEKVYSNSSESANTICPADAVGNDITTDGVNLYLAGSFAGSTSFGSATLNTGSNTIRNGFLTKLDYNGNTIWAQSAGNTENIGYNVMLDNNNNDIYFFGQFNNGTLIFNGPSLSTTSWISFLAKYTTAGSCSWATTAGRSATTGPGPGGRRLFKHPNGTIGVPVRKLPLTSNSPMGIYEISTVDGSLLDSLFTTNFASNAQTISDIMNVNGGYVYFQALQGSYDIGGTTVSSTQAVGSTYSDLILVKYTNASTLILSTDFSQAGNSELQISPNPVSDWLYINSTSNNPIGKVLIYDNCGRMVISEYCNYNSGSIHVSQLPAGIFHFYANENRKVMHFIKLD